MAHSGKSITFAMNVFPNENNIYSLGDSDHKWKIFGNVTGNISTASGTTLTANSGSTLYLNKPTNASIIFTHGGADTSHELARFDTSGNFVPKTGSNYTIGTSSNKWTAIYATTFYGALSGNATSSSALIATKTLTISDDENTLTGTNQITYYNHINTSRPANCPSDSYNSGLIVLGNSRGQHDTFQLEWSGNTQQLYMRGWSGTPETIPTWNKILHSGNTASGTNNAATLTWSTTYTIAKINGTDIKFTTMAKPTYTYSDVGAAAADHGTHVTAATVKSALGTGSDTTKFLNNKGEWAVPAYTTSLAWSAITSKPNLPTGNARIFYGTSNTAAGTAAKVVTCSIYDAYTAGDILVVKFDNANTAGSPTLNVNSKGAKNIKKIYNGAINNLTANGEVTGTCLFIYDGTQWILTNVDYNNTYTIPTSFSITANATDGLWDLTGTGGSNQVTYAVGAYSAKQTTAAFYTAATNPTLTTRLNYDGYLYATKLYSNGTEVSVSGHTHSYLSSISWSGDTNLKLKQSVDGATATDVLQFAAGSNITLTGAAGKLTIAGTANNAVTQSATTTANWRKILLHYKDDTTPTTAVTTSTNGIYAAVDVSVQPSTGTIRANAYNVAEHVLLQWNSTDSALEFVFA